MTDYIDDYMLKDKMTPSEFSDRLSEELDHLHTDDAYAESFLCTRFFNPTYISPFPVVFTGEPSSELFSDVEPPFTADGFQGTFLEGKEGIH